MAIQIFLLLYPLQREELLSERGLLFTELILVLYFIDAEYFPGSYFFHIVYNLTTLLVINLTDLTFTEITVMLTLSYYRAWTCWTGQTKQPLESYLLPLKCIIRRIISTTITGADLLSPTGSK